MPHINKNGYIEKNYIGEILQSDAKLNHEMNRKDIRDNVVDIFKEEQAGTGKKSDSTRIVYCVEKTQEEEIIYLQRPAYLNKGFDFTVNVRNFNFSVPTERCPDRVSKTPRHDSIIFLLTEVKKKDPSHFTVIKEALNQIYLCKDPINILQNPHFSTLRDKTIKGIEYEAILKIIKWLFIEQDVTYWSFSGRKMFFDSIKNV